MSSFFIHAATFVFFPLFFERLLKIQNGHVPSCLQAGLHSSLFSLLAFTSRMKTMDENIVESNVT